MAWLLGYVGVLFTILALAGAIAGMRTRRKRMAVIGRAQAAAARATRWRGLAVDGIAVKVCEIFTRFGLVLDGRKGKVLTFKWPARPWLTGFLLLITFPFGAVCFLAYRFSGGRPEPVSFDISSGQTLDPPVREPPRRAA